MPKQNKYELAFWKRYKASPKLKDCMWKTGRVLVTRNHDKFIVFNGVALSYEGRISRCDYSDDLHYIHSGDGGMDIMAVYTIPWNLRETSVMETQRLLWERSM